MAGAGDGCCAALHRRDPRSGSGMTGVEAGITGGHGGASGTHPAATAANYLPSLEPPPKVSETLPSNRVNSIGKMNFVDGLSPMFLSVSRY